jgi:plastocyanin
MTFPAHARRRAAAGAAIGAMLVAIFAVAAPVIGKDAKVDLVDKSFQPEHLVVGQGDTVTWTVTKAIGEAHSVTSAKTGDVKQGDLFDSDTKLLANGDTFAFTFERPGTYDYLCIVHPVEMKGQIVVLAPGQTAPVETAPPASVIEPGIATSDRVIAAGILFLAVVVMVGAAWFYRRMNPA